MNNVYEIIQIHENLLFYEMIFDSITYDIVADSHKPKLYCYKSNFTFVEFHISMDTFDIFELIKERQKLLGNKYNFILRNI